MQLQPPFGLPNESSPIVDTSTKQPFKPLIHLVWLYFKNKMKELQSEI